MINKDVFATLERFAPLPLQDSYDNAGLQVGLTEAETSGVLLCLDVNEAVVAEAASLGYNLIVSHHPLLFHPLRRLGTLTQPERCARMAVEKGITIYAAHTNLDNARGGVNFMIAQKLGIGNLQWLEPRRLSDGTEGGSGVIGSLAESFDSEAFLRLIKDTFHAAVVMHNELLRRPVKRVALCGGAGDFLLTRALELNADAFITGEMHYHTYAGHEQQIQIAVIGHYESEQYTPEILHKIIGEAFPALPVRQTSVNTNPINYL